MSVDHDRHSLPDGGILAGADDEVRLPAFDFRRLGLDGSEIFLQLFGKGRHGGAVDLHGMCLLPP